MKPAKTMRQIYRIALIAIAIVIMTMVERHTASLSGDTPSGNENLPATEALLRTGIPAGMTGTLLSYNGFELSFNSDEHIPNWVAWELTPDEARGAITGHKTFMQDKNVEGSATPADYRNSGYDRGHMAPAADMKWSEDSRHDCYYMTNICPQEHSFNANTWGRLEQTCRQWAQRDSSIIIVTGPVLADGVADRIGASGVAVPKRFFKVILEPYANPIRAIGFIFPNGDAPGGMQAHVASVDEVEAVTGYDFFAALPDSIENIVESRKWTFNDWAFGNRHKSK